jgi:5-methylcytosine-specific restriction endonuclease McrA
VGVEAIERLGVQLAQRDVPQGQDDVAADVASYLSRVLSSRSATSSQRDSRYPTVPLVVGERSRLTGARRRVRAFSASA